MSEIPRDPRREATLGVARDPYRYVSRTARELGTDVFETRLLLRPMLCLTGREAPPLFYDTRRFQREGALPAPIRKTVFGEGGVQTLDGEAHAHRKRMMLSLLSGERVEPLVEAAAEEWRRASQHWTARGSIELYAGAQEILTRAVCRWAGVPLPESQVRQRARDLAALFDGAGVFGPSVVASRLARRRNDRWVAGLVSRIRAGDLSPGSETAAARIAHHRDLDGNLLPPETAGVELLNVLRPTVAISVYVVFLAHALHEHPEEREALRASPADALERFVQEVRRLYPFFPAVPAVVREDFEWNGHRLRAGTRTLLDLYGIDHDPRIWESPDAFRPDRFGEWKENPWDLVPQGGGDHERGHRCAGEWVTIALMKRSLRFLVDEMEYRVPEQDLRIDFGRIPALPRSRFVLADVRAAAMRPPSGQV